MSVSLRLARTGKKHAPSYKIVATNTRGKRNGRFLEIVGNYNPSENTSKINLEQAKFDAWVKKGAIITPAVQNLIDGTYVYKPYKDKKAGTAELTETTPEVETPQAEEQVEKTAEEAKTELETEATTEPTEEVAAE